MGASAMDFELEDDASARSLLEEAVHVQLKEWHDRYHKDFQDKVLAMLETLLQAQRLTFDGDLPSMPPMTMPLPAGEQSRASTDFCRAASKGSDSWGLPARLAGDRSRRSSSRFSAASGPTPAEHNSSLVSVLPASSSKRTRLALDEGPGGPKHHVPTHQMPPLPSSHSVARQPSKTSQAGSSLGGVRGADDLPGMMAGEDPSVRSDRSLGRRRSRATTDRGSNMQAIDRLSHVHILNSQPVSNNEDGLAEDPGCWLLLAMGRALYVLLLFFACLGTIPLIVSHFLGYMCSATFGFVIAAISLYHLVAICCGWCLRTALLSEDLQLAFSKLTRFVNDIELDDHWHVESLKERRRYFVAWLLLILGDGSVWCLDVWLVLGSCGQGKELVVTVLVACASFLSFGFASGVVFLLAYVHSNLLLGLDKILDCWVGNIVNSGEFVQGVRSWNSIQALLKSAGRELASSFLILQACGSLGLVVWLAGCVTFLFRTNVDAFALGVEIVSALPLTCLFLVATRLCAHGAALTEKCRNIPALVNQIPGTSSGIDVNRQYLVRFIADSAAGFIVKGVTLTQAIFLRQVYFLGTLFSGLLGVLIRVYL